MPSELRLLPDTGVYIQPTNPFKNIKAIVLSLPLFYNTTIYWHGAEIPLDMRCEWKGWDWVNKETVETKYALYTSWGIQTRQAYSNPDLDNLDIISLCTNYPKKEQLPNPNPNNQMISQVSMSRDRSTLRPGCSLGPSITRPIPWPILILRPLAAGVTCRCTAAGNHRMVRGLLVVFLVGFDRPIHTSGSGAHCVWWIWRKGGFEWIIVQVER